MFVGNGFMERMHALGKISDMESYKSLEDSYSVIVALLHDVSDDMGDVFNTHNVRRTLKKVRRRLFSEGMGFLTKTLPRLGKALDRALVEGRLTRAMYTATGEEGESLPTFAVINGTELPRLLGELFGRIFKPDGVLLERPCVNSVRIIRQFTYLWYKYELPYDEVLRLRVIEQFKRTERELSTFEETRFKSIEHATRIATENRLRLRIDDNFIAGKSRPVQEVARRARLLLSKLFGSTKDLAPFDPLDIHPKHGPGAVATRQRLWSKYLWTNVSSRITEVYPFDAYFCASMGHVCDTYPTFSNVGEVSYPALVCLVPKDSRGPRLISCEPVDNQWIQQGLATAIVDRVESHPLTKGNVRFTSQEENSQVALLASRDGLYSTLDLKEASDRVSLKLVRLLFPEYLHKYLECCRSTSTVLPSGETLELRKFAPMGSGLCFPILALTIWAVLSGAAPNAYTRERIYVYGDDVIVPTAFAADAIEQLESFGFVVNHDKSCTSGLFRESCGTDAFAGEDVTPVRFRTVWSESPSPAVYTSWIAYANQFWDRLYFNTYKEIVGRLHAVYGTIPSEDMQLRCPSLREVSDEWKPKRKRRNRKLQKLEYYVLDVVSPSITKRMPGWNMLHRFFTERDISSTPFSDRDELDSLPQGCCYKPEAAFRVRRYTDRRSSKLERLWR